jgi:uridine phosphorylase
METVPILEFDADRRVVVKPSDCILSQPGIPESCVLCFPHDPIQRLHEAGRLEVIGEHSSVMGKHPLFALEHQGKRVCIMQPGLGSPLAAGFVEELRARGCRKFVACGSAGTLDAALARGHVVVVTEAVRDEGTSYHYLPPARGVSAAPAVVAAIQGVLTARSVPHLCGKTWTTDAFYRETPGRVSKRRAEGCITVDMEASALLAVAQYHGVPMGVLLCAADDVSGEVWDKRGWTECHDDREALLMLAVECCLAL